MLILLALLLVALFFGLGFAIHALWIIAVVLFIAWLVGLAVGRGEARRVRIAFIAGDRRHPDWNAQRGLKPWIKQGGVTT